MNKLIMGTLMLTLSSSVYAQLQQTKQATTNVNTSLRSSSLDQRRQGNSVLRSQSGPTLDQTKLTKTSSALGGVINGGGGDASEMGVNLIRDDILKWISKGGSSGFKELPPGITVETYNSRMSEILKPQAVIVGFVTEKQERETNDPELKVYVNGQPKQCRGFLSVKDNNPHILCNSDRYPTGGADQYRLIHHEYAGLARIEKNIGAASDYILSNQITEFLEPELVYRLAVRSQEVPSTVPAQYFCQSSVVTPETVVGVDKNDPEFVQIIKFLAENPGLAGTTAYDPGVIMCDINGPGGHDNFLIKVPERTGICSSSFLKSAKGLYLNTEISIVDGGRTVDKSLAIINGLTGKTLYRVDLDKYSDSGLFGFSIGDNFVKGGCRPYRDHNGMKEWIKNNHEKYDK